MTRTDPEHRSSTARIGLGILLALSLFAVVAAAPVASASTHVEVSGCGEPLDGHYTIPVGQSYTFVRCD